MMLTVEMKLYTHRHTHTVFRSLGGVNLHACFSTESENNLMWAFWCDPMWYLQWPKYCLWCKQNSRGRGTKAVDKRDRNRDSEGDRGGRQRVMLWIHCMFTWQQDYCGSNSPPPASLLLTLSRLSSLCSLRSYEWHQAGGSTQWETKKGGKRGHTDWRNGKMIAKFLTTLRNYFSQWLQSWKWSQSIIWWIPPSLSRRSVFTSFNPC